MSGTSARDDAQIHEAGTRSTELRSLSDGLEIPPTPWRGKGPAALVRAILRATTLTAVSSESITTPPSPSDAPAGGPNTSILVQQGKLLDFIDQETQRDETPEEYVRQEIAKSLVREYRYSRTDIGVEYVVRLGSAKPRADIAVFGEGESHLQQNVRVLVECKSPNVKASDRKDGVGQLQSYMTACPNADYGMWTNGSERYCFRKIQDDKGLIAFADIPDIPGFGQTQEEAEHPRFDQLKAAYSDALLFAFRRCHNYIAGNQGLQKPEAFWELLKLIFCKIHDERGSSSIEFYGTSQDRQHLNGQLKVKARLDRLFHAVRSEYPQIFRPGEEIELAPPVLTYIVTQLQRYSLLESDIDVKGKAYEEIVGSNLRGDRGEFFTPRNVCRMAVAMLDPGDDQIVIDPACGTGGFLTIAMNHVIAKITSHELAKWGSETRAELPTRQRVERFLDQNLIGIDLNPNLVKAAKMNMVMNNDGSGGLFQANSLASPATWVGDLRRRELMGRVDILFTNPPFGSKIPIDEPAILESYDLGHAWTYDAASDTWLITPWTQKSQPPEILFIERCLKLLKPGIGRAAMVIPDGILGSPGLGYVRQWLLKHARILASIDMHPDTFQPSTSVQTSVVVFERLTDDQVRASDARGYLESYKAFMAVCEHVGHDKRGNVTYVRDADGNEIVGTFEDRTPVFDRGQVRIQAQRLRRKVVDDNTMAIANKFRQWLSSQ